MANVNLVIVCRLNNTIVVCVVLTADNILHHVSVKQRPL